MEFWELEDHFEDHEEHERATSADGGGGGLRRRRRRRRHRRRRRRLVFRCLFVEMLFDPEMLLHMAVRLLCRDN